MAVEQPDDVEALLGAHQRPRVALDVADVDQALDDRGARGRRPDPGVLHLLAQRLVVELLAGRLHRAQQRRVREAPRRLGLLLGGGDLARVDALVALELGQRLVGALVVLVGARLAPGRDLAVGGAPARLEQHAAAGAEDVVGDGRLEARVLPHRVGMEDGEEAPDDHVVDPLVVVAHLVHAVLGARRDDRVVVGDLGVVDHAAERQHVEPGHVGGRLGVLAVGADARGRRLDLADHVGREEARVRARVGERLVLLVEALGRGERAAGREAVAVVGLALERGQVVEERRALLLRRRLELGDLRRPGPGRRRRSHRPPRRRRGAAWRRRGSGPRTRGPARPACGSNFASTSQYFSGLNSRISTSRRARIASVGVCTRPSETAPSKEERRRMVAARVAFMPTIQSASERERAASSRRPNSSAGRRSWNACLIAALVIEDSHSRWTGFLAPAFSYSQAKISSPSRPASQALTTCVDVLAAELLGDDRHLLARALVAHDEPERVRHDRQVGHAPLLVLRVVLVGLGELDEVADRPRDDVLVGLEVALVLGEGAGEHAREVTPHGGLLGDDERLGHWSQTSGRLSGRRDLWRPPRARPRGPV